MNNERNKYTKENLQTDIDWMLSNIPSESEARHFIEHLLNSEWVE